MLRHLKTHYYLSAIFVATTLLTSLPTHATEALTDSIIKNWISSQQAFDNWGELNNETLAAYEEQSPQLNSGLDSKLNSELNSEQSNPLDISPQDMLAPLKASGLYHSAEQLVQKNGFKTLVAWAKITLRITKTAAAIQLAEQQKSSDLSELEALKNASSLSIQQKRLIDSAIKQNQTITAFLETGVSEEDKALVQPYLSNINQLLNNY